MKTSMSRLAVLLGVCAIAPIVWALGIPIAEFITLAPSSATSPVGTEHTVTATVVDENDSPVLFRQVDFEIVDGPHAGHTGSDTTDDAGQATFTYTGASPGTDIIVASFVDSSGQRQTSNAVGKTWEEVILSEFITLAPGSATNDVGTGHTVTATLVDQNQNAVVFRQVGFEIIAGPHAGLMGSDITDSAGEATFTYTGSSPGVDSIVARFVDGFGETRTSNSVTKVWEEVILAESITLAPGSATNDVGTGHTVTATLVDQNQNAVVFRQVDFEITQGPHAGQMGSDITDSAGEATFTYTGSSPGVDTIVARFVDGFGETRTSNPVTKTWQEEVLLPESISLAPLMATNDIGTEHTVTATVEKSSGEPVVNRLVFFAVIAGPHESQSGFGLTDAEGEATFTYTGSSPGTDTIVAAFRDSSEELQTSNAVFKTWEEAIPPEDDDPPTCELQSVSPVVFAFQDTGSGLAAINAHIHTNTTVVIAPFAPGTRDPVLVTLTKNNPSLPSLVILQAVDAAGNSVFCDPVLLKLTSSPGFPVNEVVTGVPEAEGWVTISNGSPGLPSLEIAVNGQTFHVEDLADGEQRTVSFFSAMRPGTDNSFVFRSPDVEGSAVVLISDVPPVSAVQQPFRRGDVNADGRVDIADPLSTLNALFLGEPPADCEKAADANDDGSVDLADPVFLLAYLFHGGERPPRPHHACGPDAMADSLSCSAFPVCR